MSKFTTIKKNESKWVHEQPRFQQYVHAPVANPWEEAKKKLEKHLPDSLRETYGKTNKERNEYLCQYAVLQRAKGFYGK